MKNLFRRTRVKVEKEKDHCNWKFNEEPIRQLITHINANKRVKVKRFWPVNRNKLGVTVHKKRKTIIYVSGYSNPYTANQTFFHELCHVWQENTFPSAKEYIDAYQLSGGSAQTAKSFDEYWDNPFEIQAREFAQKHLEKIVCLPC